MPVAVYILCFILVSGVIAALFLISAAVCRKRQRLHEMRLNTMEPEKCSNGSAPKIPLPPVPKIYNRQRTASTIVSSSAGECPEAEVEHIYETIDPYHDPAYSYAWTVPPVVLRKTKVDVQLFLSPNPRLKEGFVRQGSVGGHTSTFSLSTSGTSACQRTYSNTDASVIEDHPTPLPVISCSNAELVPEYPSGASTGVLPPSGNPARRQMIKSEYISIAAAEAVLDFSSSVDPVEVASQATLKTDGNVATKPAQQIEE
jgi:hypothetical protein